MKWEVPCQKKNGEFRKSFQQWSVPKKIYSEFGLQNGESVRISVRLGEKQFGIFDVRLFSGWEFKIPCDTSPIEKYAHDNPDSSVSFSLCLESEKLESIMQSGIAESLKLDSTEREKRLQNANKLPERVLSVVTVFKRNPDVVAAVLERAAGFCERCKQEAPFKRKTDNSPYLEVHHTELLANHGEDTVENAEALCPNCHRKAHYG